MTDLHFDLIEKAGMKKDDFVDKLHLVFMLSDIQEMYLLELERIMKVAGFYGFEYKQVIKDAITRNQKVVKVVDNVTSLEFAEEFGDKCDELKTVIDKWAKES